MKKRGVFRYLKKIPDDRKIADLWIAPYGAAAVTAAIETGITEALHKTAKSPAQLANELDLHAASVESVLRVLAAYRFARQTKNQFALSPDAQSYLVPSSPLERREEFFSHFETNEHRWVVRKLRETSPTLQTFGDRWKDNPEEDSSVKQAAAGMDSIIKAPSAAVIRSGAFQGVHHLLDVGGGSGAFAVALAEHQRETRVTILDLPAMCKQAQSWVARREAQNIAFHPADFFKDKWASGCDAIYFSNILHDWPEQRGRELLRTARDTVEGQGKSRGRLYVLEVLRQENKNGPLMATIFHMQMQMGFGGLQYTRSQFADACRKTGWGVPKAVASFGYYTLLSAYAV
jgi:hypothetical protein